jgi:Flp pilus assembly protein TadG
VKILVQSRRTIAEGSKYMRTIRSQHRGIALIYTVVAFTALLGICSLAVDYGRVQLVKSELQRAADAAARAGASNLGGGITATQDAAVAAAGENTADGSAITITASDVEFLTWNSPTDYTVLSGTARSAANAVRVTLGRTKSRGNAISLSLASVVGQSTCDVSASSVALVPPISFGIVGLNYIKMGGNSADSYWSPNGYIAGRHGSIASNGNITLSGSSYINGDARPVSARPSRAPRVASRASPRRWTPCSVIPTAMREPMRPSMTTPKPVAGSTATAI